MKVNVFKALGHETRLKIVEILATEGPKCVCELVERLPYDQSTISRHLGLMKASGILSSSKDGLNVTYEIKMPCVYQFIRCLDAVFEGKCAESCQTMPKE